LYSDHHFHLGYFLYAMAYYATHYPSWLQANRERVLSLARDVGNPSLNDKYFPIVRNKDFYVGISWATGVVGGLRQAESSTEAIMCYHGLAALGLALGDATMQSVGQLMLAVEIRSVREYYHVRANNQYFFPQHIKDYGTIGQFAEDAIFYYTLNWPCDPYEFPMRHACLVGIQVIPIISVSGLYMDQEWGNAVLDICGWAIDPWSAPGADQVDQSILRPVSLGWGTFCHAVTSQSSSAAQQAAATYVKDLTPGQLVGGTGVASTLTFIYAST
jgi:endo-1,3(4)-beta-glucanase